MEKVFVILSGPLVAVASNPDDAERQLREMISSRVSSLISSASYLGEVRASISARVCHVEVNQ